MATPTGDTDTPDLARPRTPRRPAARHVEPYVWLFMRLSGLVLIVLVLGQLFVMIVPDGGVERINFAYVAGHWSSPLWRTWDLVTLWLAEIHGVIGLRTVIDDYARRPATRRWLTAVLYVATVLILVLGTFVIATFDPNITSG